jgi:hypothetical protein
MGAYLNASNESRHAGAQVRGAGAQVRRDAALPMTESAALVMTFMNRLFCDFLEH